METGSTWNGWTVESLVGEGSFGKVYKIVREEFGHRYVSALKVIRIPQNSAEVASIRSEGMSDASITSYYENMIREIVTEFALMSDLRGNSSIVSYEDHEVVRLEDEFGWTIYIRMEFLTPLYNYLKEHPLTEKTAVRIGIDMCKALEICKQFNVIHRDIKPENIFVSDRGGFKLGDFGIAKQLDKANVAMSRKGTYSYMAPEVYRGDPYDASVDTYSLGIVLYKFLNDNRTPFLPPAPQPVRFQDKDKATVLRMRGEPLPPPSKANDELAAVILKACAYDPKDRYSDPHDMRMALEALYPEIAEQSLATAEEEAKDIKEDLTLPWNAQEAMNMESTVQLVKDLEEKGKTTRRKLVFLIAAVIAIAGIAFGVHSYIESNKVRVPDIVGVKEGEAQQTIEDAGLVYVEKREFSEDVKQGRVMSQSISPDSDPVSKGTEVEAVVSRGKPITTPDFKLLRLGEAERRAENHKLKVKVKSREYSDDVTEGRIISQEPAPEEDAEKGQEVLLVVSKGIEPITVPDVTGMTPDKARQTLTEAGLRMEVKTESSDKVPSGQIIRQSVEPGSVVDHNSVIVVIVSTGSATVDD